jgi:hypothetical protein
LGIEWDWKNTANELRNLRSFSTANMTPQAKLSQQVTTVARPSGRDRDQIHRASRHRRKIWYSAIQSHDMLIGIRILYRDSSKFIKWSRIWFISLSSESNGRCTRGDIGVLIKQTPINSPATCNIIP